MFDTPEARNKARRYIHLVHERAERGDSCLCGYWIPRRYAKTGAGVYEVTTVICPDCELLNDLDAELEPAELQDAE